MNLNADLRVGTWHGVLDAADRASPRRRSHVARLPIGELMTIAPETVSRCVVTTSDRAGRLADRSAVRCMGWAPLTGVQFDVRGDVTVVVPTTSATSSITTQGHLRLPLAVRRRGRIDAGSRLLVVAWPETGTLAICPQSAVEEMLLGRMRAAGASCAGSS